MAKHIPEEELEAILEAVRRHPGGVSISQIAPGLKLALPRRTLQYRIKHLVDNGRLVKADEGRWAKYRVPPISGSGELKAGAAKIQGRGIAISLSKGGAEIRKYLRQPPEARTPAGYDRDFLDSYRPNVSSYLSPRQRAHLREVGQAQAEDAPAGTYARQILSRLLIDLAWNSSRLEGNTYSMLDTRRLIEFGEAADERDLLEAQMILNHKDAIEFLVDAADEIGFNRYTILNLHAMLANNLLDDPAAAGRLRHIAVGIGGSAFHPLAVPQLIEEYFDQVLATADAINDPFEQSCFLMVQLPYLQPFDDVNKRVSRLAANIPLIKSNLSPLSFTEVPRTIYTEALLGVYELRQIDLFRDLFIWAYKRSAARYTAVRQSLGDPDPFRLQHRDALRAIVGEIVRRRMSKKQAFAHLTAWARENIDSAARERFRDIAEGELLGLHEGNFARYQIRPAEFEAWQQVWSGCGPMRFQST